jgi:type II secretory pathway component PulF
MVVVNLWFLLPEHLFSSHTAELPAIQNVLYGFKKIMRTGIGWYTPAFGLCLLQLVEGNINSIKENT